VEQCGDELVLVAAVFAYERGHGKQVRDVRDVIALAPL